MYEKFYFMIEDKNIVFFDGICNFCDSTVDFIWNNNKKRNIYYASLQSRFAQEFLKKFNEDIKMNTIYYHSQGVIYKKSKAVFKICVELKNPYPILGFLIKIPSFIGNVFYDFISNNRYSIMGEKDSCRILSNEEKSFFLD